MTTQEMILKKVHEVLPKDGTLIFLTKFGSHLYGTNTENSDTDYKGVYVPSYRDMILGTVRDSVHSDSAKAEGQRNTKHDTDIELLSIQKFIALARAGETMAIDMLHANEQNIVYKHPAMDRIFAMRKFFYTKNLKAFVGYCRKQAAKYGLKGSRLDAIKDVLAVIDSGIRFGTSDKLSTYWNMLPVGEHSRFIEDNPSGIKQYEICGKVLQETMGCIYAHDILSKYYQSYGARAIQAQKNEGVDWKAISHAFRAAFQVRDILTEGYFRFPLPEAGFLRAVKLGEFKYPEIADKLETLIEEVSELSEKSRLPEHVDLEMCNDFVYNITTEVNGNEI
jgi:hypothetical protein